MGKVPGLTVAQIGYIAADRADMLKDDGTGTASLVDFVDAQALTFYINMELAALWDALIASHEDYCIYRRFIDVVADVEDYSLPEDFYKFRKVFPIASGKRCDALKRFDLKDLGAADSLSAILTSPIEETKYKITGNRLWLHPTPTSAARLELWYVPQFKLLENSDDLIPLQFPNGWEEYIIEGVAARMLEKEESDSSPMRRQQEKALQRILVLAEDRDVGEPHQMQDTDGYLDPWS